MFQKKDAIIFVSPATESQPAKTFDGVVVSVSIDGTATCSIASLQNGHAKSVVIGKTGKEIGGPGFAIAKNELVMPIAVTEKVAAKMIGYSRDWLRAGRSQGAKANHTPGPAYVKKGHAVRYLVTDLFLWLYENRQELKHPEEPSALKSV